ncbi:phytanoyl-CoA dioxygenase family protein [Bordetella petrii]|uniref:phytanoyl-CoA dioxygenase family protein n=1 Tax=Bordetella petrii TaxID=94624 RepID=UPI0037329AC5
MTDTPAGSFAEHGYVRLAGFHPRARMMAIRRKLLDEVQRVSGRGLPGALRGLPVFQQIGRLSSMVQYPDLHEALMSRELLDLVAHLAGRPPAVVQDAQLLLSPPRQGAWTLAGLNWHVDVKAGPRDRLPGIQAFFLIDDVAEQGGATLALAGSHRHAPRTPQAAALRERLRAPGDLLRNLRELDIDVVEMAGRAGDVYLMDMRVLHTPSVNATPHMRMMATSRCLLDA